MHDKGNIPNSINKENILTAILGVSAWHNVEISAWMHTSCVRVAGFTT